MASGYEVSGTDLDDLFEPRGGQSPAPDTGYEVGGVDISNRYYPLSAGGSSTSVTGYEVGGADLNTIFAAIGTVGGALTASLSTTTAIGLCLVVPCTANSGSVTCNASGGSTPYSYAWEQVSGDISININSPTNATTTFSATSTTETTKQGVFRCKVTDNSSNIVYSNNVTVTLTFGEPA